MKKGKSKILAIFLILIPLATASLVLINSLKETDELISIRSESELKSIYDSESYASLDIKSNFGKYMLTAPFSFIMTNFRYGFGGYYTDGDLKENVSSPSVNGQTVQGSTGSGSKDYSTTNIQVQNVDEADIVKTDGDYIYSLSETDVVITDVRDPKNIKIAAKIESDMTNIPEDLIILNNKLVVISETISNNNNRIYDDYYYDYYSQDNTTVKIYNINNKENPTLVKSYTLYEPYYTSRCIGNKLYVISSGVLRKDNDKIVTYYTENFANKEIELENIKYLKDIRTRKQTLISYLDLNNPTQSVKVNSYLMDIENAYVSENNIYLLDDSYSNSRNNYPKISSIFGLKGVFGLLDEINQSNNDDDYYGQYTNIYKFNILSDGNVKYSSKAKEKGVTINQYSVDEYNDNLRVALYNNDGSRIVIFNNQLKKIGETPNLAKGERMYSSRFMENKAYLVTYRTMDPLYVVDLQAPTNPIVLGELKIPGYSTYLHPYDENHIIGIGMETKEIIRRDQAGKVSSTFARVIGMKMALFDVSDVSNPVQISQTMIGDSRTTSAILTNPKALLFSKEKSLIAIPVNNYAEDFAVNTSEDNSSLISSYTNGSKSYISEGYLVYNINTTDGFKLKGTITHETAKDNGEDYYYYTSRLLRGLYIEDNLYTVSENMVKVNELNTLKLVNEMKIREVK